MDAVISDPPAAYCPQECVDTARDSMQDALKDFKYWHEQMLQTAPVMLAGSSSGSANLWHPQSMNCLQSSASQPTLIGQKLHSGPLRLPWP